MYKIYHNKALNTLEIENSKDEVYGKIHLDAGASLQELTLKGHTIIKDLAPLTYANTYASSILFPFANRIKDGAYTFNDTDFQFEINHKDENNALHGLVYNKTFQIIEQENSNDSASILLEYEEKELSTGFPYTYIIQLKYVFTASNLSLQVAVKNTDSKAFPFTLGWHPYFLSDDLYNSSLHFNSDKKLVLGDRNITVGVEYINFGDHFKVENQQLDDCWILNSNDVTFKTPKYELIIESSADENNFLQVYTPPKPNTIAIEPTTGVSDSFNNNIGLKTLNANDSYSINWNIKIK
ncbi:aldose 1-epimerase [Flavivirga eckloniae]|uniref:Aldose 1-epimerase n=1 Tax=Flavivirga eckloniae TaxID=1803846 RepID=A0A2K9PKG2_9FLAO|nr:aldose 1-epimerase [Flavivirga eckloniae]AUP77559.1 aldose 1-epimerase [Flavivirga eckloniae]